MKKLSKNSFEKARSWIDDNARPLEKALLDFHFESGDAEIVLHKLQTFQNTDGGFGNALEPDLRTPSSSVLGTSLAFQILRTIKADSDNDFVMSGLNFLVKNYNEEDQSWRIVPSDAEDSPHAPWWNQKGRENHFEGFNLNPTAEILGYLYDNRNLVEDHLIADLTSKVFDELSQLTEIEMHDFLCCKRLLESNNLDQGHKQRLQKELVRLVDSCILKDYSEWDGYGLRPVQVVDSPNSPFTNQFRSEVEENLDYEVERQNIDGVWQPTWSWGDNYSNGWEVAKKEWTGIVTLDKLVLLNKFGRLER
jgi:hypothetical protein